MTKPQSDKLFYENDSLSISFSFKPKYIEFELYNKLEEGIRINWDEVSIAINGKAKRVIHYETGSTSYLQVQPPTTIPPKSKLVDGFILSENVSTLGTTSLTGKAKTILYDIYPIKVEGFKNAQEKVLGRKGEKTTVFFPMYIRNEFSAKTFEFIIQDISIRK